MPDHAHTPHAPFQRKEDRRLVTGHGLYVDGGISAM